MNIHKFITDNNNNLDVFAVCYMNGGGIYEFIAENSNNLDVLQLVI